MRTLIALLCLLFLAGCAAVPSVKTPVAAHQAIATQVKPIVVKPTAVQQSAVQSVTEAVSPPVQDLNEHEVHCMAEAIYFEARGESLKGQEGVGYVVMNRVQSRHFPTTVCGVVYQSTVVHHGRHRRRVCQFGWACQRNRIVEHEAWAHALDLARLVMLKMAPNPVGNCIYFHSAREGLSRHARYAMRLRIDHHLFYRYELAKI